FAGMTRRENRRDHSSSAVPTKPFVSRLLQRGELHALCEATTYRRHTGLNYHRSAKDCRFRCWSDTAATGRK
ncbi:hypothetical protein ACTMTI_26185, partial [Nonomuraea sp. H19]|uniref:hypothetical protein n=1 Tax=Nonomuraea sp. H19 TaxID=3452206 RepID=UPI003F8BD887